MSCQVGSPCATDGRGLVGPATQRIVSTGAPLSSVKSVEPRPSGMCNGRSRFVHKPWTPSCRRLLRYGALLGSTIETYVSLPTYADFVPRSRCRDERRRGSRYTLK